MNIVFVELLSVVIISVSIVKVLCRRKLPPVLPQEGNFKNESNYEAS